MPDKSSKDCRVAVIWIDWYAYHVARFVGLLSAPGLSGRVCGIELVGGVGVHAGLKFRQPIPAGLPVETIEPTGSWLTTSKFRLSVKLWKRLSALNPELVLVPGYATLPALASALWARVHGRVSVLMTESAAYDHVRVSWKEAVKRITLKLFFDYAVAGGRDHMDYLDQLGFSEDRVAGFYDVVDNDAYLEAAQKLREGAAQQHGLPAKYFLYAGRLASEKNVRGLIAAWLIYRFKGGTWSLVLAGDGPERAELQSIVNESSYAADVYFTGLKSTAELMPFYAFASCFVLPSSREPWGLVVNEAMASGLPVLVSDHCGCAADLVVDGENGWIFNPEDELRLAALLHTMEELSDEERARMSERSLAQIRPYSPARFGLEVAQIANRSTSQRGLRHLSEPSA